MIERFVVLPCPVEAAFKMFTDGISDWWHLEHRLTKDPASTVHLQEGERFLERATDGREVELGRVRVWERPVRLVLDFYLGTGPDRPTEVLVRFEPRDAGTRVSVEHRATPLIETGQALVTDVLPSATMAEFGFATRTTINATPEAIWAILTDAERYPSWNPTVRKVDGRIAAGERITVHATISPGRAFPVTVAELVPGQRMVWAGGMPLGLFKGVRTFTLAPTGEDVEFHMQERFNGPLASIIRKSMPDLQPAFDEFAAALKKTAERR